MVVRGEDFYKIFLRNSELFIGKMSFLYWLICHFFFFVQNKIAYFLIHINLTLRQSWERTPPLQVYYYFLLPEALTTPTSNLSIIHIFFEKKTKNKKLLTHCRIPKPMATLSTCQLAYALLLIISVKRALDILLLYSGLGSFGFILAKRFACVWFVICNDDLILLK